ncbi:translocation/assembly module TamB domain-containing protein [Marinoscillum furvescens]|uniref:Uncharacterized protein DUF490 n=1 Tax=Marinoscillum furvescens DSM 4134 TaxID=1122208 RepID=A0A3D9LIR7_MARFU|nr:translocation/assembly module TamB domain-containing protein [Marinoscillum furvescens]REE05713.1 uncharacterized protein DUF490 [Marinoscillum furvescens DSM 4134]
MVRNILKFLRRVVLWTLTFLAIFLTVLILLLQTPLFQNFVADVVVDKINQETRQSAKFKNIQIKWFDFVEIKGLEVFDYKGEPLVAVGELSVDFQLSKILNPQEIAFDQVYLQDGGLYLHDYDDDEAINLVEFINDIKQLTGSKPKDTLKKSPSVHIDKIRLDHFQFAFYNEKKPKMPKDKFDYGNFLLEIPGATLKSFLLVSDTIEANIESLAARDPSSGLTIQEMSSLFHLSNKAIDLSELYLKTSRSEIRDKIRLEYSGLDDLGAFVDSVSMDIHLKNATIDKRDIDYFADIPAEGFDARVTAQINGTVPHLSIDELQIYVGQQSHVYGSVDFMGLPRIEETFIDARLTQAFARPTDLKPFLGPNYEQVKNLGAIGFSGSFLGFVNDFVARGEFNTREGNIASDINLKFPADWEDVRYSGKLQLEDFNVGALLEDPSMVGAVNMDGTIKGKGATVQKARFYLNADLWQSEFFGYRYDSIQAEGDFASEFFKGRLSIADPNCQISTEGSVDLAARPEVIAVSSKVDALDLFELGFVNEPLSLSGSLQADVTSLNLDSLQGKVQVGGLKLRWKQDSVELDSIMVASYVSKDNREIAMNLPEVRMRMAGDFSFSQLTNDAKAIFRELEAYVKPDYQRGEKKSLHDYDRYSIDFELQYDNIADYIKLLDVPLYLSPGGHVTGTYYQRSNATLSVFAEIDSINYQEVGYKENTIDINLSKDLDSASIIASVQLMSGVQNWRKIPQTNDLLVEAVWNDKHVDLSSSIRQPANNSSLAVNGQLRILTDRLVFSFLPSRLILFDNQWFFNPYNKVVYTEDKITVDRLELYQNDQSILLKGSYSDSALTNLTLNFDAFELKTISGLLPLDVAGVLNSSIELQRQKRQEPFILSSDVSIVDFELNEFLVGDVSGKSEWNPDKQGLKLDLNVVREGVETIAIGGYYTPDAEEELAVEASFNKANLQVLDPFSGALFSNIGGLADGDMQLNGTLDRPVVTGESTITNGRMRFDYLGTTYEFDGAVAFDNNAIKLNGIRLVDKDGDKASLTGAIQHDGFTDFYTNLNLAASEFQFLNTTASDNSLYYGTANASGDISVRGPFDDLVITAKATTEKGTKLYIPLSGESEVSQKEYISFVDFSDTTDVLDIEEAVKNSISGVRLDFEIDVTPDAYVELIFDIRTGDIIRGRGAGNLNLTLDTNGEFELFGDLNITEGAYNFTVPNFVNKEFSVVPGSTISWYGDPYAGVLDLEATYRQLASFDAYLGKEEEGISTKYPVLVVLKLNGEMLSPTIDFEIKLEDSRASPANEIVGAINTINNDEQQLKKQVFSLLILRKLSPPSSFAVSGGMGNSLSEFVSNQFSYFISQVDENLEVDIDLASMDANAFNTFQLRLSYTFLDGRLQVSGGGGMPQGADDVAGTATYIGDWSVRYLLTPDGHLRVKAFSQTEQVANDLQRETGVSFQYLKSFNDFKELLSKTREESIRTAPKNMEAEKAANES